MEKVLVFFFFYRAIEQSQGGSGILYGNGPVVSPRIDISPGAGLHGRIGRESTSCSDEQQRLARAILHIDSAQRVLPAGVSEITSPGQFRVRLVMNNQVLTIGSA